MPQDPPVPDTWIAIVMRGTAKALPDHPKFREGEVHPFILIVCGPELEPDRVKYRAILNQEGWEVCEFSQIVSERHPGQFRANVQDDKMLAEMYEEARTNGWSLVVTEEPV